MCNLSRNRISWCIIIFLSRAQFASIFFRVPSTSCCERFCPCFSPRSLRDFAENKFLSLKRVKFRCDNIIFTLKIDRPLPYICTNYAIIHDLSERFYACLFKKIIRGEKTISFHLKTQKIPSMM